MPNYIIYIADRKEEINECAYSLLKYLDIYNLKPPPSHSVVIYTTEPAMLEAYGSYFTSFRLVDISGDPAPSRTAILQDFFANNTGSILYMDGRSYPVKELEGLFAAVERGNNFFRHAEGKKGEVREFTILAAGTAFKPQLAAWLSSSNEKPPQGFIERYDHLREFDLLLKDFFRKNQEESISNQVKAIHHLNAHQIQDQKMQFQKLPFYTRMLRRITGKGWRIRNYSTR